MKFALVFTFIIAPVYFISAQDISALQTLDCAKSLEQGIKQTSLIAFKDANASQATQIRDNEELFSPYKTKFVKDGLVLVSATAVTLTGYVLIKNKKDLTPAQLATKTPDKLPFFDRFVAGNYSDLANEDSYILFYGAYAIPPVLMLLNSNELHKLGQLTVMYVETIGITGAMYTLSAGLVYRSRPFVYGNKADVEKRLDKGGQRSFYGGHVATCAAASFFAATVFSDFNPESKLRPFIWTGAALMPIAMAYLRMRAGYHFLSDCIISYGIGAATGILIPKWHRKKFMQNISITPTTDKSIGLLYHIR